jgi:hypothetical protein
MGYKKKELENEKNNNGEMEKSIIRKGEEKQKNNLKAKKTFP